MSFNSFIPTLWESRLLTNLNDSHHYANCVNRDYEGEIKGMGSTVKINSIGRISTSSYTRNTTISAPEELDLEGQYLTIDTANYFNFAIDDVDEVQARGNVMSEAMKEAAWSLSDDVDDYLGSLLMNGAGLTVTAATVGLGAAERSLYDVLVEMGVKLDETNTPSGDRFAVVPPWAHGMMLLDERFVDFGTSESNSRLRGEPVKRAAGFNIMVSNNVPRDGSEYVILAGYKGAATFAEQVRKTEAYRAPDRFSDAVKGLHVFGGKVTRPSNICRFDATQGTFTS